MHKLLARQTKRVLGVEEARLPAVLEELQGLVETGGLSEDAKRMLAGLGGFFQRVDEAYQQNDRDLDLKTRSLALSSVELTETNTRIREELASRTRAIDSLRETAMELMQLVDIDSKVLVDDNLESLSTLMSTLVRQREESQHDLQAALTDLAYQKFALDQHAIVSMTDLKGNITYANDKLCEISGYAREELLNQNHRMINSGVHSREFFSALWRTIVGGSVWHGEICNRSKNGSLYWVNATIVPLRDDTGNPTMYIAIRTDISERKRMFAELQKAKEDAEAGSRAKSDFLANMSHEIRTPMNGVIGMTELLMDTPLDAEQREYLAIVQSSSAALLRVINDILDFSKIEAGKLLIEHISFNLGATVSDTLKTLALRAYERGLELICDMEPDVPMAVVSDPGRLRQILVNIIGNAIKFTDKGEVLLHISCQQRFATGVMLHFAISDSGIGIPQNKLKSIFDAFSQEDSSITRKYGGTGLGLTICARLVEALGGRIWVESELGKGSVFHFQLRMELDPVPLQERPTPIRITGQRVLIVDDNQVNRQVLSRALQSAGALTHDVASGMEALQWLSDASPTSSCRCDMVLLDAQMPEMDGFTTAERILQLPHCAQIPLVMVSSAGIKGDAQRAREVGMVGYLTKPIARDELLQAVAKVLNPQAHRKPDLVTRHSLKETQVPMTVLLVEDHVVNQRLAIILLERWGHRVSVAENGQIALDMLSGQRFDIILMDMMMPVMDGLEATRRFRALESGGHTPIIAMTANAMDSDRQRCLDAGMDDYISKPIKAQVLHEMLQRFAALPVEELLTDTTFPLNLAPVPETDNCVEFDYATSLNEQDQEMVEIIAQAFIDQWPQDEQKMRNALAQADFQGVLYTSHALKGTLSMFGAFPARDIAARIEALAGQSDASGIAPLLAPFSIEVERLLSAMRRHNAL